MNKAVMDHIETVLAEIRMSFLKAADRIESLKPGEKIPATKLAEALAKEQGKTGPQVYPILKLLFDDYPGVEVKRGAMGGIYRPLPGEEAKRPLSKPSIGTVDKIENADGSLDTATASDDDGVQPGSNSAQ